MGKRLARLDPAVKQNIAKMRAESATKHKAAANAASVETPLVPHDPMEDKPAIIEIRAGTAVDRGLFSKLRKRHAALVVAVGAQRTV